MHVFAFLHQHSFDGGRNGRMRLKILDRLDLAIRRNQAADRAALHFRGTDLERGLVQVGIQNDKNHERLRTQTSQNPAPA